MDGFTSATQNGRGKVTHNAANTGDCVVITVPGQQLGNHFYKFLLQAPLIITERKDAGIRN